MTPIAWRDEYSVGLPDVDHEHRVLIAMINEAAAALGPQTPISRIVAELGEICARIAVHFALRIASSNDSRPDRLSGSVERTACQVSLPC